MSRRFIAFLLLALMSSRCIAPGAATTEPSATKATAAELALASAAYKGDIETVKRSLRSGANVNAAQEYGTTVLWFAAKQGHFDIVTLLLANGANPNLGQVCGLMPLMVVKPNDDEFRIGSELIDHGANVKAVDHLGDSALHHAAIDGRRAFAVLLMAKGADINSMNNKGQTPFRLARMQGNGDVADALIAAGARE
jgi:ankyrin repeat protein